MGTFQDTDGKGYLLIHHGPVYRLSDDYRSIEAEVSTLKAWANHKYVQKERCLFHAYLKPDQLGKK